MTASSNLGYYERIDADALSDTEPVSAPVAYAMRNNLLHLRDQFTKHVISWSRIAGHPGSDLEVNGAGDADAGSTVTWPYPFLHTWLSPVTPTNLDYKFITGVVGTGDVSVRLRIIPHYRPGTLTAWSLGDPAADSYALVDETQSGAVVSSASVTFDDRETFTTEAAQRLAASIDSINLNGLHDSIDEDGSARSMFAYVMRAEIILTSDDNFTLSIGSAHLREYV